MIATVLLAPFVSAQEATSTDAPPATSRRPLFSREEIDQIRQTVLAREAEHEAYIRTPVDDDVVLLEPYIVEGDDSLLLARIRRALESGYSAHRRPFIGIAAATQLDLVRARFKEDAFFRGPSAGAPEDHVTGGVDLLALPFVLGDAIRKKNVMELFRAPPGAAGGTDEDE